LDDREIFLASAAASPIEDPRSLSKANRSQHGAARPASRDGPPHYPEGAARRDCGVERVHKQVGPTRQAGEADPEQQTVNYYEVARAEAVRPQVCPQLPFV
jgi:hypothetical protein